MLVAKEHKSLFIVLHFAFFRPFPDPHLPASIFPLAEDKHPFFQRKRLDLVSGAIDVAAISEGVYYTHLFSSTMKPCFSGKKNRKHWRSKILVLPLCRGVRLVFGVDRKINEIGLEKTACHIQ